MDAQPCILIVPWGGMSEIVAEWFARIFRDAEYQVETRRDASFSKEDIGISGSYPTLVVFDRAESVVATALVEGQSVTDLLSAWKERAGVLLEVLQGSQQQILTVEAGAVLRAPERALAKVQSKLGISNLRVPDDLVLEAKCEESWSGVQTLAWAAVQSDADVVALARGLDETSLLTSEASGFDLLGLQQIVSDHTLLAKKIAEAEQEKAQVSTVLDDVRDALKKKSAAASRSKYEAKTLRAEIQQYKTQISDLMAEKEELLTKQQSAARADADAAAEVDVLLTQLVSLQDVLETNMSDLASARAVAEDRGSEVAKLNDLLKARQSDLQKVSGEKAWFARALKEADADAAAEADVLRAQISTVEASLVRGQEDLKRSRRANLKYEKIISEMSNYINDLKLNNEELRAALSSRDVTVRDFEESTSWRLTAPMRKLKLMMTKEDE